MGIDIVMECTGEFLTRAPLQPYFDKGIKKVCVCMGEHILFSAPLLQKERRVLVCVCVSE